jgi:hypothetical protein
VRWVFFQKTGHILETVLWFWFGRYQHNESHFAANVHSMKAYKYSSKLPAYSSSTFNPRGLIHSFMVYRLSIEQISDWLALATNPSHTFKLWRTSSDMGRRTLSIIPGSKV